MKVKNFIAISACAGLALLFAAAIGTAQAQPGPAPGHAAAERSADRVAEDFSAQKRKKAKSRKPAKSQKKATKPKGGKGHLGHH